MLIPDSLDVIEFFSEVKNGDYGLFEEQQDVLLDLISYILDDSNNAHYIFDASGGCGKTYLTRVMLKILKQRGITGTVVAFTGRACSQLRKGMADTGVEANTIHSVFYKPVFDDAGVLLRFDPRSDAEVKSECGSFIVVDEGSMIPKYIFERLKSLRIKLIIVGDQKQLPPVDKQNPDFNAMFETKDAYGVSSLQTNRRTDQECDGIVRLYETLKTENTMPRINGNGLRMVSAVVASSPKFLNENEFDIVICGTNKKRKELNSKIRKVKFPEAGIVPVVGETVICMKNEAYPHCVVNNGERFIVDAVIEGPDESTFMLTSLDSGAHISPTILNDTWITEELPSNLSKDDRAKYKCYGYGYAVSCHRCQGSSFDRVLFFDENVSYFLDRQKFRYTAVTRAAKHLTVAL